VKLAVLSLLFAGCVAQPSPTPVKHVYPPADCNASCENQRVLKCDWYLPTCIDDCTKTNAALASLGSPPMNTGCLAASKSCGEALKCRGGE